MGSGEKSPSFIIVPIRPISFSQSDKQVPQCEASGQGALMANSPSDLRPTYPARNPSRDFFCHSGRAFNARRYKGNWGARKFLLMSPGGGIGPVLLAQQPSASA